MKVESCLCADCRQHLGVVKRGRGSKAARLSHDGDLSMCIATLHDIASGESLRDTIKMLGLDPAGIGFDAQAFQWAQGVARGTLKRIGEPVPEGRVSGEAQDRDQERDALA